MREKKDGSSKGKGRGGGFFSGVKGRRTFERVRTQRSKGRNGKRKSHPAETKRIRTNLRKRLQGLDNRRVGGLGGKRGRGG